MSILDFIFFGIVAAVVLLVVLRVTRKRSQVRNGTFDERQAQHQRQVALAITVFAALGAAFTIALGGVSELFLLGLFLGALVGAILAWIASAVARTAERKERSWLTFFWLAMLLNPLIVWLVVALLPEPERSTATVVTPDSSQADDSITKIERLAKLKASGAISDDEYQSKKQTLLDGV